MQEKSTVTEEETQNLVNKTMLTSYGIYWGGIVGRLGMGEGLKGVKGVNI